MDFGKKKVSKQIIIIIIWETQNSRAQLKIMASHSIVNTRAVDDLVIDEDDQLLPKTRSLQSPSNSLSNSSSASSDTDEEPAGLVKDTIKGMCMCYFQGRRTRPGGYVSRSTHSCSEN